MWSGPLHNKDFVGKLLAHVGENEENYNTSGRMKGMLTVAREVSPYLQLDLYSLFCFVLFLLIPL